MGRRLEPHELRAVCDPERLGFPSTAELPAIDGMIDANGAYLLLEAKDVLRNFGAWEALSAHLERLKKLRIE